MTDQEIQEALSSLDTLIVEGREVSAALRRYGRGSREMREWFEANPETGIVRVTHMETIVALLRLALGKERAA